MASAEQRADAFIRTTRGLPEAGLRVAYVRSRLLGEDVAELSGINLRRVRIMAFGLAGFFFGVAGVLAAAQLGQSNAVIADGRLFAAVTAVVVGGTALTGGEGGVLNTLVGVLIVTVLANGMILLGISPYIQQTVQGLMIIAAVALSLDRFNLKIVK